MRYVKGTIDYGLLYTKSSSIHLVGYSDVDQKRLLDRDLFERKEACTSSWISRLKTN